MSLKTFCIVSLVFLYSCGNSDSPSEANAAGPRGDDSELRERIATLEALVQKQAREIEHQNTKLTELERFSSGFDVASGYLEGRVNGLSNEMTAANSSLLVLNSKISDLSSAMIANNQQDITTAVELGVLDSRMGAVEAAVDSGDASLANLSGLVTGMSTAQSLWAQDLQQLGVRVDNQEQKLFATSGTASTVASAVNAMLGQVVSASADASTAYSEVQSLRNTVQGQSTQLSALAGQTNYLYQLYSNGYLGGATGSTSALQIPYAVSATGWVMGPVLLSSDSNPRYAIAFVKSIEAGIYLDTLYGSISSIDGLNFSDISNYSLNSDCSDLQPTVLPGVQSALDASRKLFPLGVDLILEVYPMTKNYIKVHAGTAVSSLAFKSYLNTSNACVSTTYSNYAFRGSNPSQDLQALPVGPYRIEMRPYNPFLDPL